jgi:hypothetical protein
MHKALVLFLLALLGPLGLWAQSNKIQIIGTVRDTFQEPLADATVLLLDPLDSTLVSYTRANANGEFELKNIKAGDYLVKISFVGFVNHFEKIKNPSGRVDIGVVTLKEISKELFEVVIREARAPMTIRGDTIEYDASTFKVPPGSTVEELLRRLPGLEIGPDGGIKSEGQDVTRVMVDGKQFFGSDPKAATKNLPAEGIAKVQVYREVTEEEKVTGNKRMDGNKTMNLELKEEFKKGGFGKIIAGAGTEDRWEIKGNYNKFDEKNQISFVGVGNNTGRNGLGWNDYQDFKGNQAFNFDDGVFGFGGGGGQGRRFVIRSGGGEGISNSFFGSSDAGFPEVASSGINYNHDNGKERKFSGLYFFDYKGLQADAFRTQQVFLPTFSYTNRDTSGTQTGNTNHSIELSFEDQLDSLTTLSVKASGFANRGTILSDARVNLRRQDGTLSNVSAINNDIDSENYVGRVNAILRRKFLKEGRNLGLSASYGYSNRSSDVLQRSENLFFSPEGILVENALQNQIVESASLENEFRFNVIFVEPLKKNFFLETFYNFSNTANQVDRFTGDREDGLVFANDSLSRYSDNVTLFNRLGSSIRFTNKTWNIQTGASVQQYRILGEFRAGPTFDFSGNVDNLFRAVSPYLSLDYSKQRNKSMGLNYILDNTVPSFDQLQPVVDNSNPLLIREGNPNLLPTFNHNVSLRFRMFNPMQFTSLFTTLSYTYTDNPIIFEQVVNEQFVTFIRPINYRHRHNARGFLSYGFPIVKNKFTVNTNYSLNLGRSFALVNEIENQTRDISNRITLRLNITPLENISLFLGAEAGISDITYSLSSSQDQRIVNQNYSATFNTKLPLGLYFNSDYNYSLFQNQRFGFDTRIPILNLSLYKVFLKDNKGELRFTGFDVFDQNRRINQFANANQVSDTLTTNLARYFMLSFTYNMRGVSTDINPRRGWF